MLKWADSGSHTLFWFVRMVYVSVGRATYLSIPIHCKQFFSPLFCHAQARNICIVWNRLEERGNEKNYLVRSNMIYPTGNKIVTASMTIVPMDRIGNQIFAENIHGIFGYNI